jgi:hypothetical protein
MNRFEDEDENKNQQYPPFLNKFKNNKLIVLV